MARSVRVALMVLLLTAAFGGSALAQAPGNDDRGSPTVVGSLPFHDAVDTSEATSQDVDGDLDCFGSSNTVWYSFTPANDNRFVASTAGSDYDTTLAVARKTGNGPELIDCNDDAEGVSSRVVWQAVAGEEYLIMAGDLGRGGGALTFHMSRAPRLPTVSLTVFDRGDVTRIGAAIIRGTVRCSRADGAFVSVSGRQDAGRRIIRVFGNGSRVGCGGRWWVRVSNPELRLAAGPLRVTARVQACNEIACDSAKVKKVVRLR